LRPHRNGFGRKMLFSELVDVFMVSRDREPEFQDRLMEILKEAIRGTPFNGITFDDVRSDEPVDNREADIVLFYSGGLPFLVVETKRKGGMWRLLLPSFQRSFVWDEEDVKRFLESILLGCPTGTILLWKPSNPKIDPFALNMIDALPTSLVAGDGEVYYVVDGQQRLTLLILLMHGWKVSRVGKTIDIDAITANPSDQPPELYINCEREMDSELSYECVARGDFVEDIY